MRGFNSHQINSFSFASSMGTVLVLSLLALLALTSTHAGLMDRLDLHKYRAIRDFREPRTGAWVYTAALKKGASARQLYAGLTASISSLKKHNTKWPVVVIVGDGIGEEFTQVLKALDVDQVLEVDRDILPHHRRSGQVIDAANAKVTDQYYGHVVWVTARVGSAIHSPQVFQQVVGMDVDTV